MSDDSKVRLKLFACILAVLFASPGCTDGRRQQPATATATRCSCDWAR